MTWWWVYTWTVWMIFPDLKSSLVLLVSRNNRYVILNAINRKPGSREWEPSRIHMCQGLNSLLILGMVIPPSIGNRFVYNPLFFALMTLSGNIPGSHDHKTHLFNSPTKTASFSLENQRLQSLLVGGWTNPSEKYARQIGFIFPQ